MSTAKIKIHETKTEGATPSEQLIKAALSEETVTDGRGRKLWMRKPGVLAQFRLTQAVGPEVASNHTYMQMINPLIYLGQIDGEDVYPPANMREVEALIAKLDDEGLAAVNAWYIVNVINPTVEAIQAEEQKARLKNS